MTLLEMESVSVEYFGSGFALRGVDLHVEEASCVAVLGPNGAGKTSLLRAIGGFLPSEPVAVQGSIRFGGKEMRNVPIHSRARRGLVLVPEEEKIFRKLTVQQNLSVGSARRTTGTGEGFREMVFDLFPVLYERRELKAGYLSGGERQMLAIAKGLSQSPKLLLADEISMGIAPKLVGELVASLKAINRQMNIPMIVVEQNAGAALELADYIYVLEAGEVALQGLVDDVRDADEIVKAYFGG